MSQAKVQTVAKSQKDQGECEHCGDPLPKGSAYRWFVVGFRSKHKHVRCTKAECTPRQSERESSRYSEIYAVIEDAEEELLTTEDKDSVETLIQSVADAMTELAEEYRDASTDDQGNVFNTEAEERADALKEAAGELDGWSFDEEAEPCEEHGDEVDGDCEECTQSQMAYRDDLVSAAQEKLSEVSI